VKTGLFVGNIAPEEGGGFTYVTELLRALEKAGAASAHEFVICHHAAAAECARMFPGFPALDLDRERSSVLSVRERLFSGLPPVLDRVYREAMRPPAQPSWDERLYARHGIEFLVRLIPWNSMTLNVPFAAVHWDLQHRNNPWFPEVSGAEWDRRERNFSSLLRRAAVIYTGTHQGRREIEQYYQVPAERICVVPFAAPRYALAGTPADAQFVARLGLPRDYLFYPAQFWTHKNHVVVLEACRLVREESGWDLGVVFSGSDKGNAAHVNAYARKLGLEAVTRNLGFVGEADLVQLYKHAYALAFATFCGPDNIPPLEAFGLGCPVIASRVPGAEEQLGDAALLFAPEDERALAARILELRDPAVRLRLIEAGERRARQGSWEDYAAAIISSLDAFSRIRRAW